MLEDDVKRIVGEGTPKEFGGLVQRCKVEEYATQVKRLGAGLGEAGRIYKHEGMVGDGW